MKPRPIKLPSVLCCIGQALEVDNGETVYKWPIKDRIGLYSCPKGKILYCIQTEVKKNAKGAFDRAVEQNRSKVQEAMGLYDDWHGFDAVSGSVLKTPRGFLHNVGRAASIVYSSDKWVGRPRKYIHEFRYPPLIWVNKKHRPTVLVLNGGKIRVKKEGITG